MQPRGVLVTAAGPAMRRVLHDFTLPRFVAYAEHWGLAVEATDLTVDGNGDDRASRSARWKKIELLRRALTRYPFAAWLDADVLIVRQDEDVSGHLTVDAFQALALEQVPSERRLNPNTGVWLLRSGPTAFAFLDLIDELGPQPGPWADQGAVLAALGWERGDARYHGARPGIGNRFLVQTTWLPPAWNQPYLDRGGDDESFNSDAASYPDRPVVSSPFALHFMGMRPEARYRHMAALAGRGERGGQGSRRSAGPLEPAPASAGLIRG